MNTQPDQKPSPQLQYKDDPAVREIFADCLRLANFDGTVKLEFAVARPEMTQLGVTQPTLYPAARLVVTLPVALELHRLLTQMIQSLEQQGVMKRRVPSADTKQ